MSSNQPQLPPPGGDPQPPGVVRIDVVGKDPARWERLQAKLFDTLERLLELPLDQQRNTTVGDEIRDFTTALLDFGKAKLAMPLKEIEEKEADIRNKYAELRLKLADARLKEAEARRAELTNRIRELRLSLGLGKAMLIGERSKRALLIGERIDEFLRFLKELAADQTF